MDIATNWLEILNNRYSNINNSRLQMLSRNQNSNRTINLESKVLRVKCRIRVLINDRRCLWLSRVKETNCFCSLGYSKRLIASILVKPDKLIVKIVYSLNSVILIISWLLGISISITNNSVKTKHLIYIQNNNTNTNTNNNSNSNLIIILWNKNRKLNSCFQIS